MRNVLESNDYNEATLSTFDNVYARPRYRIECESGLNFEFSCRAPLSTKQNTFHSVLQWNIS
jgi:hypothetical protein